MPSPYYTDDRVTIYCGDCREVISDVGDVGLVLTDPPYGIADRWVGGNGHGWAKPDNYKEEREQWDSEKPELEFLLDYGEDQIIRHRSPWGL